MYLLTAFDIAWALYRSGGPLVDGGLSRVRHCSGTKWCPGGFWPLHRRITRALGDGGRIGINLLFAQGALIWRNRLVASKEKLAGMRTRCHVVLCRQCLV